MNMLIPQLNPFLEQMQANAGSVGSDSLTTLAPEIFVAEAVHPGNLSLLGNESDQQSPLAQFLQVLEKAPLNIIRQFVSLLRTVAEAAENRGLEKYKSTMEEEIFRVINQGEVKLLRDTNHHTDILLKMRRQVRDEVIGYGEGLDKAKPPEDAGLTFSNNFDVSFEAQYQGLKMPFSSTINLTFDPQFLDEVGYVKNSAYRINNLMVKDARGKTLFNSDLRDGKITNDRINSLIALVTKAIGTFRVNDTASSCC